MKKKQLLVANWKMNKTLKEAEDYLKSFKNRVASVKNVTIVICPPLPYLLPLSQLLADSKIKLGAQNIYLGERGAFTGEVSAPMIKNFCQYVILGHSERRKYFAENDEMVNKKIISAMDQKLKPIVCLGETEEQKESGQTKKVVESQVQNCFKNIKIKELDKITVAYEPIWAISTYSEEEEEALTPEAAQVIHKFIRQVLGQIFSPERAKMVRIIYGGSIDEKNIAGLVAMPDMDGGLVGGESLKPESFAEIINKVNFIKNAHQN